MSSTISPDHEPTGKRRAFQFSLRTLLALTALTAWLLGWAQIRGAWAILTMTGLALIEAGFFQHRDVLQLLVRNLAAYFFVSLAMGGVGLGLACGSNPTGFFGTDHFLVTPFAARPAAEQTTAVTSGEDYLMVLLRMVPGYWTTMAIVVHWVLAGRARWPAYILVWLAMAGLVSPIFMSWTWDAAFGTGVGDGWLARLGFKCFAGTGAVAGWVVLAGALVLGPRRGAFGHRLGLLQPTCSHALVALGAALILIAWGPVSFLAMIISHPDFPRDVRVMFALKQLVPLLAGLLGAAIASPIFLKRFHLPLILCGAMGAMIAAAAGFYYLSSGALVFLVVTLVVTGLVAGGLVVLASWFFDRVGIDDPGAAVAVFCVCSVWGSLAAGLLGTAASVLGGAVFQPFGYGDTNILSQAIGTVACFLWSFPLGLGIFLLIKQMFLARTTPPAAEVVLAEVVPEQDLSDNGASGPEATNGSEE